MLVMERFIDIQQCCYFASFQKRMVWKKKRRKFKVKISWNKKPEIMQKINSTLSHKGKMIFMAALYWGER